MAGKTGARGHATRAGTSVEHDLDHARLWTTPEAVAALDAWLVSFVGEAPEAPATPARTVAPPALHLTPRLPAPVRALGWHAVKALSPAHQPLRMDERHPWSWNHERLAAPERDWGVEGRVAIADVDRHVPHPFI